MILFELGGKRRLRYYIYPITSCYHGACPGHDRVGAKHRDTELKKKLFLNSFFIDYYLIPTLIQVN